jgi:hypothetical protein
MEFLNTTNLEILNRGNEPTLCSGGRLEVTHYPGVLEAPRKYYRLGGLTSALPVRP